MSRLVCLTPCMATWTGRRAGSPPLNSAWPRPGPSTTRASKWWTSKSRAKPRVPSAWPGRWPGESELFQRSLKKISILQPFETCCFLKLQNKVGNRHLQVAMFRCMHPDPCWLRFPSPILPIQTEPLHCQTVLCLWHCQRGLDFSSGVFLPGPMCTKGQMAKFVGPKAKRAL